MGGVDVGVVVDRVLGGSNVDETILDYIKACLEDEFFDWGEAGEGAYDAFGSILCGIVGMVSLTILVDGKKVDGGCVKDDDAAKNACKELANQLAGGAKDVDNSTRALEGGPLAMGRVDGNMIVDGDQSPEFPEDEMMVPGATAKDLAKMEKRLAKEEKAQRAALDAHNARAKEMHENARPRIVRDQGQGIVGNIKMENFSISNGGKELIQDATLMLAHGRRYGLIGRNGTGKTTLLRAMSEHAIKGIPSFCQVVHVEQEAASGASTVLDSVLECDEERSQLLTEEKQLMKELEEVDNSKSAGSAASERLTKVYERLNEIDAYNAENRAASILSGLSFSPEMMKKTTGSLSGGWRMRVALAQALFVQPDLLLLDEPTNHLDLHAVFWLEECLAKWPKTVLIVSHAREFLNAVCTDTIHLHSNKLISYRGNFDVFERTMRERLSNQMKQAESQDRQRKHVQAFIDKFRYNAKRASLVQSRIKALKRMADVPTFEKDPEYQFKFPEPGAGVSAPILGFNDVCFNYPGGPELFTNLNFGIDLESRFAIVGPNGIGKSTLLNLISGTLEPTQGNVQRNQAVKFAIFSQHHVDGLDLALTPLQYMLRTFPDAQEQVHRGHLGSFGISGPLALQPMYTLSGGQKNRVALAKVTWNKPHVLLLDEPSNHLDMDAVDALIEGLTLFKGAVLMVSHDQYLIESTVDELWMCEDGKVTVFHGTFEEYKERLRKLLK